MYTIRINYLENIMDLKEFDWLPVEIKTNKAAESIMGTKIVDMIVQEVVKLKFLESINNQGCAKCSKSS